ncbi:MAG: PDGLE domain-containing protein [Actinomycetota bacterium]
MRRRIVAVAFCAVAILAALAAPFASEAPDGLQRVARDEGFAAAEQPHTFDDGPVAGYEVEGVGGETSRGLSALAGVVVAFATAIAACWTLARLRARRGRGAGP